MRIFFWDLETSPLIVPVWQLWDNNIDHSNILEETNILCACVKELGKGEMFSYCVSPDHPRSDRELCEELRDKLSEADVLVAHNGNDFDIKIFNGRLLFHGLRPLPGIALVDTKLVAKSKFRIPSVRLDYLGKYLGLGRKKKTSFKLWLDVMNSKVGALHKMIEYCKQDVRLLEKVYLKMRPFMTNHPNWRLFDRRSNVCPKCGRGPLIVSKHRMTRQGMKFQFVCKSCGGYSTGEAIKERGTNIA